MDWYENNQIDQKNEKSKKIIKIMIILLVIMFVLAIVILCYISYLKNKQLKFYIDDVATTIDNDMFLIQDDDVYISIRDISSKIGYSINNGEYKNPFSEDTTKCYLDNSYETVSYISGSNVIYKLLTKNNSDDKDYEYYEISKPVIVKNNKLYTISDGLSKGCNLVFSYTKTNNTIKIYTLPYLVKHYTNEIEEAAISEDSNFANQKALLYDMIVVKNTANKYGVNNLKNESIIGEKYREITFVEYSQEFIVKTDEGKVGIITKDGKTKINPDYSSIKEINKDLELYLVSNNGKYGVVNKNGKAIIPLDYETIGVSLKDFPKNDIDNRYILYDKCIPVKKDNKWGLLDLNGNVILPIEYSALGCKENTSKSSLSINLILIPEYRAIVVCKDRLYGLVNWSGKELIPEGTTDMYAIESSSEKKYYLTYNNETMNIVEYLTKMGIKPFEDEKSGNITEQTNETNLTNTASTENNTNTTNETNNTTGEGANQNRENNKVTNNVTAQ